MNLISSFLKLNKLKINDEKTVLMRISKHKSGPKITDDPLFFLAEDGKVITPAKNTKLLGLIINHKLSWSEHIFSGKKSIKSYINSKLGAITNLCKSVNKQLRIKLIGTIINSKIAYAIQNWGSISKSDLRDLQTFQNKAARMALQIFNGSTTKVLLNNCGLLSIKQLIWYHSLILLWKIVNTDILPYFKSQISLEKNRAQNLRRLEPKGNLYLTKVPSTI